MLLLTASVSTSSQTASVDFPKMTSRRPKWAGRSERHQLGAGVYAIAPLQSCHPLNQTAGNASLYVGEAAGLTQKDLQSVSVQL